MDAAEIEKALDELEHKAEHLRALYEQYFMGIDRLEPLVPRRDVERRILALRREQLRNTAQRFKFNTLVQRFNTMQQHWSRIVREIENGTYRRDVLRAAARFGEGALAALGKKKSKDIVAAIAKAQEQRKLDEPYELGEDDLVEDEADEDEAPTPPKLGQAATGLVPPPAFDGLGQGDLPVITGPGLGPSPSAPAPVPATLLGRAIRPPAAAAPLPGVTAPPQRSAGLRWGGAPADPGSAVRVSGQAADPVTMGETPKPPAPAGADVKQRVAALAAGLAPQRPSQPQGGFGELDLDFDESPSAPPVAGPAAPRVSSPRAPVQQVTTGEAPKSPARRAPAPDPRRPQAQAGFGVLDISLEVDAPLTASPQPPPHEASSSPGSGIRPGGQQRPVSPAERAFRSAASPAASPAAPAAAGRADGQLADQRIRQIYAQYVETKRSTQESTAGVTYEKLAASLRAQAEKLRSAHPNRSIDYEVVIKDGKTHLKPVLR